ncbi:MAG: hypothetical protein ACXWW0_04650 [Bacteroidia bacterium]
MLLSFAASAYANYGTIAYIVLSMFFIVCALPAILFINKKSQKLSKYIEYSSALWTIAMYLILGAAPMLHQLIQG